MTQTATYVDLSKGLTTDDLARLSPQCREYATTSPILLRKAHDCVSKGELLQACVYGWGAAEDITKAVAENWKEYGVECGRPQDLRALVNSLSVTDPEVIQAVDIWKSDYAELGEQRSRQALNDRLDALGWDWSEFLANGFYAATDLLERFYESRANEFIVKNDLKRVEQFVGQMQVWLLQPCPPDGFQQFHNQ